MEEKMELVSVDSGKSDFDDFPLQFLSKVEK